MRVFALSDVHVDYPENLEWVLGLSNIDYQNDVLILAGDVSDDLKKLELVFEALLGKFCKVLFVPGNHELWVQNSEYGSSLDKLAAIDALCARLGVSNTTCHLGAISFVPLLGWYDYSFAALDRHLRRAWRDFKACKWPPGLEDCESINRYFLERNTANLDISNDTVISFSHFVPRIDVMPDRIPEHRRRVYPVLGSELLGEQVSKLNPDMHVYGHTHVNRSVHLDGIVYVNNAFGYPQETRIARKTLHCVYEQDAMQDSIAEAEAQCYP